jgi:hypothetical protein
MFTKKENWSLTGTFSIGIVLIKKPQNNLRFT